MMTVSQALIIFFFTLAAIGGCFIILTFFISEENSKLEKQIKELKEILENKLSK